MLSDNFDKEIKESLEQRNPAYDEKAWAKMRPLLDKYLPLKKDDRRRLLFLLFLFLLLGGGSWLALRNSSGKEKLVTNNPATGQFNNKKEEKNPTNNILSPDTKPDAEKLRSKADSQPLQTVSATDRQPLLSIPGSNIAISRQKKKKDLNPEKQSPSLTPKKVPGNNSPGNLSTHNQNNNTVSIPEKMPDSRPENKPVTDQGNSGTINTAEKTDDNNNKQPVNTTANQEQDEKKQVAAADAVQPVQHKKQNKKPKGFLSNLGITFSAGADASIAGLNKTGQLRLNYGAGLSYAVSKRITIRSGFYASRKVYTARPEDYNPPPAFWNYYTNLKKIDADCKIYEVPVNIDFWFTGNKKHNWFASAGLSSFFMKKEEYNYLFKPPYSPNYVSYKHTYENENKHYFSILNISGGYSRKINNIVTLQAEPYMKVALNGIGYGKVKLNSGGILFTATIKPFSSGKK